MWVPIGTTGLRPAGPLLYTTHLNSQEATQGSSPLTEGHDPAQPRLFYLFWIHPGKAQGLHPYLFSTRGICVEYVPTFPFLRSISCMRESVLSSSCAAFTADWYASLGALPTFCNVSCPVYWWIEHIYQLIPPDTGGWSHTFYSLPILSVSFFQSNFLFWT